MSDAETVASLCEKIEKIKPLVLEHAALAERKKRLAAPVVEALRDAGLFRMFRPRSRGGFELNPSNEFRVAEALAKIDSAAAWNVQIANSAEAFGGWFSDDVTQEVFSPATTVMAGAFNPHRRATVVDGGYHVSGRVPFTSNCHGSTWQIGLADVYDGNEMRIDSEGQPETLLTLIPSSEGRIIENWNTLGLGGTGSHDVEMQDVFVPSTRAVPFIPLEEPSPAYASSRGVSAS